MNAGGFMIGDWVHIKHGRYLQLELDQFHAQGKFEFENYPIDFFSTFEPIPLTKEIFELNGFWEEGGGFAKQFFGVGLFTTWKSKVEDVQCILVGTVEVPLRYVHDLQHALRLCGLCEFADNLKIK